VSNLLQFASPAATIIAACVAVYFTRQLGKGQLAIAKRQADIAAQQARLADVRLRHDLYDRRFAVYDAARMFFLREILPKNRVSDEALYVFVRGIADAVFIVDKNVTDYLQDMQKRILRFQRLTIAIDTMQHQEERKPASDEKLALRQWFEEQPDVLIERFRPFLTLDPSGHPADQ
jgi:hypothetical protein